MERPKFQVSKGHEKWPLRTRELQGNCRKEGAGEWTSKSVYEVTTELFLVG